MLIIKIGYSQQDFHFSYLSESAQWLNPAVNSSFRNAPFSASVIYKDQWTFINSPYKTLFANLDITAFKSTYAYLNGGLTIIQDIAGNPSLNTSLILLNISSFLPTANNFFIAGGISAGVGNKNMNFSALSWGNQFTNSGFDKQIPSYEKYTGLQSTYFFTIGSGIAFSYLQEISLFQGNDVTIIEGGFYAHHLNSPKIKFFNGNNEKINPLLSLFIRGKMPTTNGGYGASLYIRNQAQFISILIGPSLYLKLSSQGKYTDLLKKKELGFSLFYRHKDAIIPSLAFYISGWSFSIGYDITISKIENPLAGGFELIITYVPPKYLIKSKR